MSNCECVTFRRAAKLAIKKGLGVLPAECPRVRDCVATNCAIAPLNEPVEIEDVLAEAELHQIEGRGNVRKFQKRQMHSVEKALGVVFVSQQA